MADAAHPACILETRKTAPGLRLVDKWAVWSFLSSSIFFISGFPWLHFLLDTIWQVVIGGGQNHRMGLFDMVMIKDNHISVSGGVAKALKCVDQYLEQRNLQMGVEVISSSEYKF